MFVPNSDAIGLFPGLTDEEALLCINYCLISRSMVEVAGWLYQTPNHPRMKWLRKAICCPNNGQDVFFADYDYRHSESNPPMLWYLKTPHFSLLGDNPYLPVATFAVFNLEDQARTFQITPESFGLKTGEYDVTDIWTLETVNSEEVAELEILARSSRLFAINVRSTLPRILDADCKITSVKQMADENALVIDYAYPGKFTLVFSKEPTDIRIHDQQEQAVIKKGLGNWRIEWSTLAAGNIVVQF